MRPLLLVLGLALGTPVPMAHAAPPDGFLETIASGDVASRTQRFLDGLKAKGLTVFAVVDHRANAERAGLTLRPTTLVVFGNPKVGTPMMEAAPTMGIELPMKVLFVQADDGVHIVYPDIEAVGLRHGLPADHDAVQKAKQALKGLTDAAAAD